MTKLSKSPSPAWNAFIAQPDAIDQLCARIEEGETLTAITEALQIGRFTLTGWIASDPVRSARVNESRKSAAATYEEQALGAIRQAADPFELAKAKEEAHHLRWKASKANPRQYGDKLELSGEVAIKTVSDDVLLAELAKNGIAAQIGPAQEDGSAG
jgi:hypothetical protein